MAWNQSPALVPWYECGSFSMWFIGLFSGYVATQTMQSFLHQWWLKAQKTEDDDWSSAHIVSFFRRQNPGTVKDQFYLRNDFRKLYITFSPKKTILVKIFLFIIAIKMFHHQSWQIDIADNPSPNLTLALFIPIFGNNYLMILAFPNNMIHN